MSAEMYPVPAGRREPFRITIENEDGDPCHHFTMDSPVEIWLLAGPGIAASQGRHVDAGDMTFMVETLNFPNYEIARRHADALSLVCRLLQNAIDDAREHTNDAIPTRDDGHKHIIRFARYKRAVPFVAMCEVCMQELVPDVAAWAAERGLLGPGGQAFRLSERHGTVKAAIEHAFNPNPGLTNG